MYTKTNTIFSFEVIDHKVINVIRKIKKILLVFVKSLHFLFIPVDVLFIYQNFHQQIAFTFILKQTQYFLFEVIDHKAINIIQKGLFIVV